LDGRDEVAVGGQHDEVDGVKVLFTAEATAQIGLRINGGQRITATWTDEAEPFFPTLAGPVQMVGNDTFQRNLIPQTIQQVTWEVLGHGIILSRHEGQGIGSIREVETR
jgi:hypothetical protein